MSDVPPYDKLLCFISCTLTTSQVTMTTKRCSHGYNTLCDSMWSIYIFIWYNKQRAGFAIISCVQYLQAGFIAEKYLRVSSCISIIGFEISFLTNIKLNFLTMCFFVYTMHMLNLYCIAARWRVITSQHTWFLDMLKHFHYKGNIIHVYFQCIKLMP